MPRLDGNNPKRRIAPQGFFDSADLARLAREVRYRGSPHHKRIPTDYGFNPPASPRPRKSLCDNKRRISLEEAKKLFVNGITLGMVSSYSKNGLPKYVWAVDQDGEAYEAKLGDDGHSYHGYRLDVRENNLRQQVIKEWHNRLKNN